MDATVAMKVGTGCKALALIVMITLGVYPTVFRTPPPPPEPTMPELTIQNVMSNINIYDDAGPSWLIEPEPTFCCLTCEPEPTIRNVMRNISIAKLKIVGDICYDDAGPCWLIGNKTLTCTVFNTSTCENTISFWELAAVSAISLPWKMADLQLLNVRAMAGQTTSMMHSILVNHLQINQGNMFATNGILMVGFTLCTLVFQLAQIVTGDLPGKVWHFFTNQTTTGFCDCMWFMYVKQKLASELGHTACDPKVTDVENIINSASVLLLTIVDDLIREVVAVLTHEIKSTQDFMNWLPKIAEMLFNVFVCVTACFWIYRHRACKKLGELNALVLSSRRHQFVITWNEHQDIVSSVQDAAYHALVYRLCPLPRTLSPEKTVLMLELQHIVCSWDHHVRTLQSLQRGFAGFMLKHLGSVGMCMLVIASITSTSDHYGITHLALWFCVFTTAHTFLFATDSQVNVARGLFAEVVLALHPKGCSVISCNQRRLLRGTPWRIDDDTQRSFNMNKELGHFSLQLMDVLHTHAQASGNEVVTTDHMEQAFAACLAGTAGHAPGVCIELVRLLASVEKNVFFPACISEMWRQFQFPEELRVDGISRVSLWLV